MPSYSLKQLALKLSGRLVGDENKSVNCISDIRDAEPESITFLSNPKYEKFLENTRAGAVLIKKDISIARPDLNIIYVDDTYRALGILLHLFNERKISFSGISSRAMIEDSAILGSGVKVAPGCYIGYHVRVGDNTVIFPGVHIGDHSRIGSNCIIYPNATIYDYIEIGDRVIIHGGSVIGSDGFGFAPTSGGNVKILQIGTVKIEDDVEIGANVTIDRATFGATRLGKGVKVDNLVQIAHNVEIGVNTMVVAQAGIAGSAKVGKNVILAAKAGVSGHLEIGDNVKVAAKSGVMKSVSGDITISGFPARPLQEELRVKASIRRLPELIKRVKQLEQIITSLKEQKE